MRITKARPLAASRGRDPEPDIESLTTIRSYRRQDDRMAQPAAAARARSRAAGAPRRRRAAPAGSRFRLDRLAGHTDRHRGVSARARSHPLPGRASSERRRAGADAQGHDRSLLEGHLPLGDERPTAREAWMTGQPAALRAFEGAVAVITGGASGIGKSLAEALAERGCEVIVADLQTELAEETVSAPRARGARATASHLDVTDFSEVSRLVRETVGRCGRLDYMFNNAGIGMLGE